MENFTRVIKAKAYQITFEDKDKEDARKGIPVSTHGNTLRYDQGKFSVLIHTGENGQHAFEGDIVVTEENGKVLIMTEGEFEKFYTPVLAEEAAEEEEAVEEEVHSPGIGDQKPGLSPAQKPLPPPIAPIEAVTNPLPNVPAQAIASPTPPSFTPASENGTVADKGELELPSENSGS